MTVFFEPSILNGTAAAPPSKSMTHRLLFCAGLCPGESRIGNVAFSDDILATVDCLKAFGVSLTEQNGEVVVHGTDVRKRVPSNLLDCRECGTTLRFILPLCMLSGMTAVLSGCGRLLERPLTVYETLCRERQIYFHNNGEKITVCGKLNGGIFTVPGDVSSQFISGLLFALPLLETDSEIEITGDLQSRPYVEMTLAALRSAGIIIKWKNDKTLFIPGRQIYSPVLKTVEGDWSNAAFLFALRALGHRVEVTGLDLTSIQGDRICLDYFNKLKTGRPTLDISDCPDLGPVLMAVAAANHGARLTGTKRLKIKESDRGVAMAAELSKLGVKTDLFDNEITVACCSNLHAPEKAVFGHNDHRIVMSLAVLLTLTGGSMSGYEAVNKSWPDFFTILQQLKGKIRYET